VRLAEAPSHGEPIRQYDPLSPGARAYDQLADEVIRGLGDRIPSLTPEPAPAVEAVPAAASTPTGAPTVAPPSYVTTPPTAPASSFTPSTTTDEGDA